MTKPRDQHSTTQSVVPGFFLITEAQTLGFTGPK